MQNYKMVLQYDGTRYAGWQKQGNTDRTIQGKLEEILSSLNGDRVDVNGSGRTDAGVHALGQTASFRMSRQYSTDELMKMINAALPEDIAVTGLDYAPPRFHARLSAKEKTYRYTIQNSHVPDVFHRRFEYRLEENLDIERMKAGAALMLGRHDYKGFSTGHTKKSTVRTVKAIEIIEDGDKIFIFFTGDGFLYNMVRIMTGTLIELGLHKKELADIEAVFSSGDRQRAGFTAPACGLCLMHVAYGEGER